jgi:hypothetical protein
MHKKTGNQALFKVFSRIKGISGSTIPGGGEGVIGVRPSPGRAAYESHSKNARWALRFSCFHAAQE